MPDLYDTLMERLVARSASIAVIGLGYVGLPLSSALSDAGYPLIGYDIDPEKIEMLGAGKSYFSHFASDHVARMVKQGFHGTSRAADLADADAIVLCVPTPLSRNREPDLSYVVSTAESIVPVLKPGVLVALESTTYPGTTSDVLKPILERSGLSSERDLFIAYSPEREDPGNIDHATSRIPKIVGAEGPRAQALALELYGNAVPKVVPVRDSATAEAVKLTENIFRSVNIALVNELKVIYDAMGIDVWEVIDGAATKPFGYMPFYPGPGLGGHCIPIDPFYLTWKAREHHLSTKFIELAGEINVNMPNYVVDRLRLAIDQAHGRGLRGAKILVVGAAYKKNVSDVRESPAVRLMELLIEAGTAVDYHDPFVPAIPRMREYPSLYGLESVSPEAIAGNGYDAVLIATDHDAIDYAALEALQIPVVDSRNAFARRGLPMTNVTKA